MRRQYTNPEKRKIRSLGRRGLSSMEIAKDLQKSRPGTTVSGIDSFLCRVGIKRRGKRKRQPVSRLIPPTPPKTSAPTDHRLEDQPFQPELRFPAAAPEANGLATVTIKTIRGTIEQRVEPEVERAVIDLVLGLG